MARFNFAGGSYQMEGLGFDAQRSVNLYAELHELGDGFSKMAMAYTPGLKSFARLSDTPRGQYEFNGRLFVVGQQNFYEIIPSFNINGSLASVSATIRNPGQPMANDSNPASIVGNEFQLLIASGGSVYLFTLATNAFTQIAASNFTLSSGPAPVTQVAVCSSFFLALMANSQTVQISNVLDGAHWNLNGQIVVSKYPDNVVGMYVDHDELWLLGRKRSAVYAATGSLNVFDPQPGGVIEEGMGAQFAASSLDNSFFWVSSSERGYAQAFRANGYTPQRISTHAIELAWQSYPKISDAVSYTYQERGHNCWVILFPSANNGNGATWVYDVASPANGWHERDNTISGIHYGHPSWNHAFAFGQHFVGDWRSTNLYVMSKQYLDNNGIPIIKVRTAPHVFTEQERIDHNRFELAMDMGVGWAQDDPAHQQSSLGGAGNASLQLQDANGIQWLLTVLDNGQLQTANNGAGSGQTIILNDSANTHSWQVGANISGQLTTTAVTFQSSNAQSIMLVSSHNFKWLLGVTTAGNITTSNPSQGIPPLVFLDWSNDGGKTWSNAQGRSFGFLGETRIPRPVWRRLGQARLRTYRVTCSESVPVRMYDAFVNALPGYQPTERIVHQIRKSA